MPSKVDDRGTERLYEIGLEGDVREDVHRVSSAAQVTAVATCTVLWSRLSRPDQLDALLDSLLGMGISPQEVYESADGTGLAGDTSYCEVRIGGGLGETVLQHLGWSHRVTQTTVVLLRAPSRSLGTVLAQISDAGRVEYVLARPELTEGINTVRAPGHGGRRPSDVSPRAFGRAT